MFKTNYTCRKIQQQNEEIKEQNEKMKEQNKKIMNQQQLIINEFAQRNVTEEMTEKLYEPLEGFPLKTVEDFEKVDSISNKNMKYLIFRFIMI